LEEAKTLDLFQKRWAVVNGLLNVKGSKFGQDKYLLARAALSQCEPIIVEWQQNLEFKDTARHWKVLLGSVALECDGQLTPKGKFRKGMKKLVNHLIASRDYENDMTKLCQQASVDKDWMDEVIRYGHIFLQWGPALWISREQKVQNYQNNGTFIYFQTNSSESDIMLGKQANWRNSIIKLLLESEIGLSIDDSRKVLQMDAVPPFYKGHQFFTKQESQPWRVWIQYRKIVLQRKNMVSSQSSDTEKWTNVSECIFEFQENAAEQPEIIVERIKEKVKSWQPQIDLQP
jgi:hypothetical protein